MNPETKARLQYTGIGAISAAVILSAALLWQDYRNGWPFSREHSPAISSAAPPLAPAAPITTPKPLDTPPANARTPLSADNLQLEALGVRFERARIEPVAQAVRAVATVVTDEARISHVHTRYSGWLEQLYVNTTGQSVRAGQALAAVFSQDLYASQNEYLTLLRYAQSGLSSAALGAGRTRLELLGMSAGEIKEIERTGQARRLVTVVAPRSGVVLRRGVSLGTAIDPTTEIVTIADLSSVWVIAEIPEAQAAGITRGVTASLNFPASGRAAIPARVDFVYPTLTERSRTMRVRFVEQNADGRLRPGLYGTAEFAASRREALTVSRDAVVDTGEAQHVYVRTLAALIEPRTVKLGIRLAERIEVTQGLSKDDEVVTAGVFLIDSESRLRASGAAPSHSGHSSKPSSSPAVAPPAPGSAPESKAGRAEPPAHTDHRKQP